MTLASQKLILARWLLPVAPSQDWFENHGLCLGEDGRIVAVAPAAELRGSYPEAQTIDLGERLLLPGMVNGHTHAAMSLMRGLANDLPLDQWLQNWIWPAEARCLGPGFVATGTELAVAEMLQTGTSCLSDMYLFPESAAEIVDRVGIRALIGLPVIDFPTPWAKDSQECLDKARELVEQWQGHERIGFTLAPHAPYSVSDDSFRTLLDWHERIDSAMPIHIHLHESQWEIEKSLAEHGVRPIERLARLGLLDRSVIAIHMVHVNAADIEICHSHDVAIIHCPKSNAHFANGIAPIAPMAKAGLRIGLGTDGAASNNSLDLYGEMSCAALLAKLGAGDASVLNAADALALATLGGAKAVGLDKDIGSLEVGKYADLQAVELRGWSSQPALDLSRLLVYAPGSFRVSDVWVAGQRLLENRRLTSIDSEALRAEIQVTSGRIQPPPSNPA